MAYLRSEKATLDAERSESLEGIGLSHIILDVLYPAISGKLMDGSTTHSGAYGTAQADGYSYYYTDIKGSKPIKDPRIGAHYGSHRHKFRSVQMLEQETAAHGDKIYSIDGREWMRCIHTPDNGFYNAAAGHYIQFKTGVDDNLHGVEFTGYFSAVNLLVYSYANGDLFHVTLDGVANAAANDLAITVGTPLANRYLDTGSIFNVTFDATPSLGIHTVKIGNDSARYFIWTGIELIAQDITSTATRSQIQIPSQNVISSGRKFNVSGTPHYDPFNGFTNSTSLHSAFVDTGTSLGLSTGTLHGAPWAISGTNNIRPFNGGRVVKWVDSFGTIKTSVNMMPPNAQNIGNNDGNGSAGVASNEITTASSTNSHNINFSDDIIDNSLAEVAKTFNWLEFGNGSANGGTAASSPLGDATRVTGAVDDIAWVMDDGLTNLCARDIEFNATHNAGRIGTYAGAGKIFITFIGTGITLERVGDSGSMAFEIIAQNLAYGTHLLQIGRSTTTEDLVLDGIVIDGTDGQYIIRDISFHQPKMPPIPKDAVVIADYMLMADFVACGATSDAKFISKGTMRKSCSRDWFFNAAITLAYSNDGYRLPRGNFGYGVASAMNSSLPYFGTHAVFENHPHSNRMNNAVLAGSTQSLETNVHIHISESTMGQQDATIVGSQSGEYVSIPCIDIHTPTHTSSHYQSIETPFLHELVGGDRNMEQTNLVVTSDGKTWDEVTRDTSYISSDLVLAVGENTTNISTAAMISVMNDIRGQHSLNKTWECVHKDSIAIAYDRYIILKEGMFQCHLNYGSVSSLGAGRLVVNGSTYSDTTHMYFADNYATGVNTWTFPPLQLKKGDFLYLLRESGTFDCGEAQVGLKFQINRLQENAKNK